MASSTSLAAAPPDSSSAEASVGAEASDFDALPEDDPGEGGGGGSCRIRRICSRFVWTEVDTERNASCKYRGFA